EAELVGQTLQAPLDALAGAAGAVQQEQDGILRARLGGDVDPAVALLAEAERELAARGDGGGVRVRAGGEAAGAGCLGGARGEEQNKREAHGPTLPFRRDRHA